jgi:hypothetical protein
MFGGAELAGAPTTGSVRKFRRCRECGDFFEPPLGPVVVVLINLLVIAGLGGGFYFAPLHGRLAFGYVIFAMVLLSFVSLWGGRRPPVTPASLATTLEGARSILEADSSPRPMFDVATARPSRAVVAGISLLALTLPAVGLVAYFVVTEGRDLRLDAPSIGVALLVGVGLLAYLMTGVRLARAGELEGCHLRAGAKGIALRTIDDSRFHFFSLGHHLIQTTIPWSQIRGWAPHSYSINGLRHTSFVRLETRTGEFKLSDLPFAERSEQIATNLRMVQTFLRTHELGGK